jgi:hypothetical protein
VKVFFYPMLVISESTLHFARLSWQEQRVDGSEYGALMA